MSPETIFASSSRSTSHTKLGLTKFPEWTNGLTWTRPSISSRTFEVEIQLCVKCSDKEDGFNLRVFPRSQIDEIGMPWKVFVGRNASPADRKFEKIFICRETPEIYL